MNIFDHTRECSHGRHGVEQTFTPDHGCEPTDEWPGSLEKIAILRARLEAGEELFHDDDRTVCGEALPAGIRDEAPVSRSISNRGGRSVEVKATHGGREYVARTSNGRTLFEEV